MKFVNPLRSSQWLIVLSVIMEVPLTFENYRQASSLISLLAFHYVSILHSLQRPVLNNSFLKILKV